MSKYLEVTAAFVVLGVYYFAIYRWWFRHLTALAAQYDVPERRKRSARRFILVAPLVGVPTLAVLFASFRMAPEIQLFVLVAFICSVAPAMIWWSRRMRSLHALGYGRQIGKYGGRTSAR